KTARDAALAYNKRGGDRPCVLRFPIIKTGDPFFHVYQECQGALDSVWEFTIRSGQVADFPHWTYDRPHRNLPSGSTWRRRRKDLWLGVSRPEERRRVAQ